MTGAKTEDNVRLAQQLGTDGTSTPRVATRRAYPGATLKHLGSVRDVTLGKTSGSNDHAGGFVKK